VQDEVDRGPGQNEYKICRNKVNKLTKRDKVNYTQNSIGNFRDSRKAGVYIQCVH